MSEPLSNLFAAVEELLKRVADSDNPAILQMRAKIRAEMIELKNSMTALSAPPLP